ncbi:MAG TPA: transferrin receptor-like dimerization domain-containing protein, partial [Pyrinomonadaceae bacterium]|nr:transferrin receptor-like dimerization domain-containing protein [Pyrinomonadaceae bacterium]
DHFGDPGFNYHVAAAQLWGTLAMRLADADGLSFDYTDYATQIREFFTEAMKLARIRNLAGSLDEKSMTSAIDDFAKEAERVEKNRQEAVRNSDRERLAKINDAIIQTERQFIDARGLRGRAWYKHQIYAPGIYTGYAAQPLTDFRQALDDRNSTIAKESLERIVEAIKRATRTLKSA